MTLRFENLLALGDNGKGEISVTMRYPSSIISVNHYKFQNRYTKPEARKWMNELEWAVGFLVRRWGLAFKPPVKVRLEGTFKDERSRPDMDNLLKVIGDSISSALQINDKHFHYETKPSKIDKEAIPQLLITISQGL